MAVLSINSVHENGAGEKIGLKVGDIVVEAHGTAVSSLPDLRKVMNAEENRKSPLSLKIERAGEPLDLNLTDPALSLDCYVKELSWSAAASVAASTSNKNNAVSHSGGGHIPILGILGLVLLFIGAYFLFLNHSETVNFHSLGIGQTLAIVGSIFIAAEWRPRTK
ncbi:PDZ domain-containing protein [Marinobacter zhanjiangensis]|uniref:PDZ domain-containing protein n=1 Tax=Marinobacter zhanjiangensis TaxID=578215 RepID=A0ABQ3B6C5_9GAMM|nr:PDZ domain-containing protein [Marinobacter zhanjiangensis]GGY81945.1 hypothetical protein GCM10007071_31620 [Marinobacter zhanjiangensis]